MFFLSFFSLSSHLQLTFTGFFHKDGRQISVFNKHLYFVSFLKRKYKIIYFPTLIRKTSITDSYHGTNVHVSTAITAVSSWRLSLCSENCKKTIKRLKRTDAEFACKSWCVSNTGPFFTLDLFLLLLFRKAISEFRKRTKFRVLRGATCQSLP